MKRTAICFVDTMTINPQTENTSGIGVQTSGVTEYWATLKASDFEDGAVEVRAVVYPNVGVPRVLAGITLYANVNGTLTQPVRYVSPTGSDITLPADPTTKLNVYTGEFTIQTQIVSTPGDHLVQAKLRYQACSQTECLPPKTIPVAIDVIGK